VAAQREKTTPKRGKRSKKAAKRSRDAAPTDGRDRLPAVWWQAMRRRDAERLRARLDPDDLAKILERIAQLALKGIGALRSDEHAVSRHGLEAIQRISHDLSGLIRSPTMGDPEERRKDVLERHGEALKSLQQTKSDAAVVASVDAVLTDAARIGLYRDEDAYSPSDDESTDGELAEQGLKRDPNRVPRLTDEALSERGWRRSEFGSCWTMDEAEADRLAVEHVRDHVAGRLKPGVELSDEAILEAVNVYRRPRKVGDGPRRKQPPRETSKDERAGAVGKLLGLKQGRESLRRMLDNAARLSEERLGKILGSSKKAQRKPARRRRTAGR
jgi:hypothetical protein